MMSVDQAAAFLETMPRRPHPPWQVTWEEVAHWETLVCSLVLFIFGILCSAAGIGGGGVYVAALVAAGNLSLHDAVPLSKAVVFFGAIASLIVNIKKSGDAHGSVIDLDTCKVIVPASLVGTFLGVLLNSESKDTTILAILTALLVVMTVAVFQTAIKQRREELVLEETGITSGDRPAASEALASLQATGTGQSNPQDEEEQLPAEEAGEGPYALTSTSTSSSSAGSRGPVLEKLEAQRPKTEDVVIIIWTMLVVMLSGILHFHIKRCGQDQANLTTKEPSTGCQHPIVMTLFGGRLEVWMRDASTALFLRVLAMSLPIFSCCVVATYYGTHLYQEGAWSIGKIVTYQSMALLTGCLAGLVGIGGGLIFSPFLLLTGMDPSIAVGTSSTCVLFTSSSTTVQYLFTDRIMISLALVYGTVALAASSSGTALVHLLRNRFPMRKSYVTFIVAWSVAVSVALVLAKSVVVIFGLHPSTSLLGGNGGDGAAAQPAE